jgi:CHAT domain-containing protein/tetratricopeptide (TPR) repeat protein
MKFIRQALVVFSALSLLCLVQQHAYAQTQTQPTTNATAKPTALADLRKLSWEAFDKKDYATAAQIQTQIIADTAASTKDYRLLAQTLELLARYTEALAYRQESLKREPENYNSQNGLCWHWIIQNQAMKARPYCEKAISIDPNELAAQVNLGHTYLLAGGNNWQSKAQHHYKAAILAIKTLENLASGPINDFDLFIKNNWQKSESIKYRKWFINNWNTSPRAEMEAEDLSNDYQHDKALSLRKLIYESNKELYGENAIRTIVAFTRVGNELYKFDKFEQAIDIYEYALKKFKSSSGENVLANIIAMTSNLANSYNHTGYAAKSILLIQDVIKFTEKESGLDTLDYTTALKLQSDLYLQNGEYDKSIKTSENIVRILKKMMNEDRKELQVAIKDLAIAYTYINDYRRIASVHKEEILKLELKLNCPDKTCEMTHQRLDILYELLSSHIDAKNIQKALELINLDFHLVNSKKKSRYGNSVSDHVLNNRIWQQVDIFQRAGLHSEALILKKDNCEYYNDKFGANHRYTLNCFEALSNIYLDLKNFNESKNITEQIIKTKSKYFGETHSFTIDSIDKLANIYHKLELYEVELKLRKQVFEFYLKKYGTKNFQTIEKISNLIISNYENGEFDSTYSLITQLQDGVEGLRSSKGFTLDQKQTMFTNFSESYQGLARLLAKHGQINRAFNLGDLSKGRTLTDSIQSHVAMYTLPEDAQIKLKTLDDKATIQRKRIEALQAIDQTTTTDVLAADKALAVTNAEHQKLDSEFKAKYPKYAAMTAIQSSDVNQASKLLHDREIFISYLVRSYGKVQVFLVDKSGRAQWRDLDVLANLDKTITATRELISTNEKLDGQLIELTVPDTVKEMLSRNIFRETIKTHGGYEWLPPNKPVPEGAKVIATTPKAAQQILQTYWYEQLIKPILPMVQGYERWIISPDKDLALLPFDTLPEEMDGQDNITAIIGQKRITTLVQSFAVYALLKQRESEYAKLSRSKDLFAMGNAVYGEGWAEQRGLRRGKGDGAFHSTEAGLLDSLRSGAGEVGILNAAGEQYAMRNLLWQNLPGTGREVSAVSSVFQQGNQTSTDTFVGDEASETKLMELNRNGALQNYRYLLFSAHGYLAQNPAFSALVLSQKGNPPEVDGYVTASEWPLYDVKSDLTVLSACDTGVGKTQAGEGVMGLPYALFVAGNKNTLLSLWPVDDDATAEFMRTFFEKLKQGLPQPQALAETKRAFMRSALWSDPRYWAAFVLYGV